jgi:uncharacterized protein YgiM (DUF1202 family)
MNTRNMKAPLLAGLLLVITILACNINKPDPSTLPNLELTITAQAQSIQQTSQVQAQPVVVFTETQAPVSESANISPTNTIAAASATPQSPQVINSTLCWVGPGTKYEVVSSLSRGETVEVIGRGSTAGWLIIRNPRYNDPCWVSANDLKVDASLNLNSLKIFDPPPMPTKTPKPTPVPSPTPV